MFKLVHAELKKAIRFFGNVEEEFIIREERVREGMEITKKPRSIIIASSPNDRWSIIAKSMSKLYQDLLLLETFAIMTYCAFSKILKKHDKVTGYNTRCAFMNNMVNKANFSNYPRTLEMLQRTQALYEETTEMLSPELKQSGLHEDERLFVNMILEMNEQAMDTAEEEGATNIILQTKDKRAAKKTVKDSSQIVSHMDCTITTRTEVKLHYELQESTTTTQIIKSTTVSDNVEQYGKRKRITIAESSSCQNFRDSTESRGCTTTSVSKKSRVEHFINFFSL